MQLCCRCHFEVVVFVSLDTGHFLVISFVLFGRGAENQRTLGDWRHGGSPGAVCSGFRRLIAETATWTLTNEPDPRLRVQLGCL